LSSRVTRDGGEERVELTSGGRAEGGGKVVVTEQRRRQRSP
jgi:hypothetical protein